MKPARGGSGRWPAARWLACCVTGLAAAVAWVALAGASGAATGPGLSADAGSSASPSGQGISLRSLVVPAVPPAGEGQQAAATRRPRLNTPAAIAARAASRMKFAHLGTARAAQVAREAFPQAISQRVGGPPSLPAGQRVLGYASTKAAQLELPGHKHALVESLQPMAIETSRGHREPVDLGLTKTGGVFESVRPLVSVLIGRHASEGAQLPEAGVSLTPVNAQGSPLGGAEGQVDGASVLYANTQTDTDTAVKPTTDGVEASSILRSVDSPEQLYFRVGLPPGASLVQSRHADGPIKVMSDGREVAVVLPPSASDAEGASVPVSMTAHGDLLEVGVSASKGEYRWPIAVDPEVVTDNKLGPGECYRGREGEVEHRTSNWCVFAGKAGETKEIESRECTLGVCGSKGDATWKHEWNFGLEMYNEGTDNTGEYIVTAYHTQGDSWIYAVEVETIGDVYKGVAKEELAHQISEKTDEEGTVEQWNEMKRAEGGAENQWKKYTETLCANKSTCESSAGTAGNIAAFKLESDEPCPGGFCVEAYMPAAYVFIAQTKAPEVSFNEEPEIEVEKGVKRLNAAYSPGNYWFGPHTNTAIEVKAHDPGVGIAWGRVGLGSGFNLFEPIYEDGKCNGIECNENYRTAVTYSPGMAEGEQSVEWVAADLAGRIPNCPSCLGMSTLTYHTVKVDAKPPSKLEVSGWPARREISATPHSLTVSATDETTYVGNHSSGVKSIAVSVDGGAETSLSGASCPLGTCTASGKYTLAAEALSEGVHRLVVTATDNANNVASEEFTFDVRHGSPLPVGPGTVDPTTGQFKLSATDVSLASAGAVSRVYESRSPALGVGGPLGPQWALSLGGGQGLTVLPTGGVVLSSSAGGTTTFTPVLNAEGKLTGEFESPLGDENLKVEAKEEKAGHGISEYLLIDSKAGTTTIFTQPLGTESTVPLYANRFGGEGVGASQPIGAAIDSSGDVWVADSGNDRVLKFSRSGALLAAYGGQGSGEGQFMTPRSVAINQSTSDVYVTDEGNNRIVELNSSGVFLATFGWGVKDGKEEFEVCKHNSGVYTCRAGIAGSGPGQLKEAKELAVDSSGNVWLADYGNNRIQEFNENGEYLQSFGKEGTGEAQFKGPLGIAVDGGNLFVAEYGNNRVQELTTSGGFNRMFGWGVTDGKSEWEQCKATCQAGIAGSGNGQFNGPRGIAVEPVTGNLYVADTGNNRVQEFTSAGKFITKFGSAGSGNGQFSEPKGIAVSALGGIYVTDTNNNRVQEWMRSVWLLKDTEGPLKNITAAYAYAPVKEEGETEIEPTEELAPAPSGVECVGKSGEVEVKYLKKGCRALTLEYPETTTAGEKETQWGNYAGHLAKVYFHAWDPSKGAMSEPVVAQYAYDAKGRLRAEWDPRIETSTACGKTCSALKATYGYDTEGHVTAATPAGQQPWAMTYGTIAGDANGGRLLKVTQAHPKSSESETEVKAKLKEQKEQTTYTVAPKLSGTAVVGVTMGVSSGTWTNSPVAYGYQWEDCNSTGKECTPILGATNPNYKVAESDVGHTLIAKVTATNSAGSVLAEIGPSSVVASSGTKTEGTHYAPEPGTTIEYRVPVSGDGQYAPNLSKEEVEKWGEKEDYPVEAMAIFPPDEPQGWPSSGYKRATIDYMDELGRTVNTLTPNGGYPASDITTTEYNTANEVKRTLSADNRAAALRESTKAKQLEVAEKLSNKTEYNTEDSEIVETLGPEHEVKLSSGEEVQARAVTHDYYDEGAKAAEEKNKETYNLLTRSTTGALVTSGPQKGKEEDTRETVDSYSGQEYLGWKLRKPTSVTREPHGLNLTTTTHYEEDGNVSETTSPEGSAGSPTPSYESAFGKAGVGKEELEDPDGNAVDSGGDIWVADTYRPFVEKYSSTGKWLAAYGQVGEEAQFSSPTGLAINQSTGNVYVGDRGNNRVVEITSAGKLVHTLGTGTAGSAAGQLNEPWGVGLDAKGNAWIGDRANHRIDEFNEEGKFVEAVGWGVSNGESKLQVCTTTCKAGLTGSGEGELAAPAYVAVSNGNIFVSDKTNNHVVEFNEKLEFVRNIGSSGSGFGQMSEPGGIAFDSSGDVYVADSGNNRVDEFSSSGTPLRSFGTSGSGNGQFAAPEGISVTSAGKIYITDTKNNRVQEWAIGSAAAHTIRTIYYSSAVNSKYKSCGEHPEWANLPCQTEPAAQPVDLPSLPESMVTYNVWDEVEKTEEKFTRLNSKGEKETVTRTKAQTYDPAGRAVTSEEAAQNEKKEPVDTALPKVTNEYNIEAGALEKQSATISGKTKMATSKDNTLGKLVEYTDAEGAVTKYVYEEGGDERLDEISENKNKEGEDYQQYSYEAVSGYMHELLDQDTGLFEAYYDIEGKMDDVHYPNGMCALTTYNPVGVATSVEYKPKACSEKTVWFSDSVVPSIHGETLEQASTLAKEKYKYDEVGRLLEAQETPAGKGCKSRLYAYDEESNRVSETQRESSTETCASTGGTTQYHTYDTVNRLTDPGVEYEVFGNTSKMPAADAEHAMVDSYYVDNQVASQEQNEQLLKYIYDPAGRTMETVAENKKAKTKTSTISHYAGPSNAPTWTTEGSEKWTHDIPGIDGKLDAIKEAGKPAILQLHDLEGNIVGTVEDTGSATKLLSTYNSTEFGVPQSGTTPPKYAWLGARGLSTEPSQGSGASIQSGASYVPQIARSLQTASIVPPGAFPNGQGTGSQYKSEIPGWYINLSSQEAENTQAEYAAKQKAREEEVIFSGNDPLQTRYFGSTGEVTMEELWHELKACGGYASEINEALCIVRVSHLYLGNPIFERFLYHPEEAIANHFGVSRVVEWGNELTGNLGFCIAAAGGYAHPMCEVRVHVEEIIVHPEQSFLEDSVGDPTDPAGGAAEFQLTNTVNYGYESQVSLCEDGESSCVEISGGM